MALNPRLSSFSYTKILSGWINTVLFSGRPLFGKYWCVKVHARLDYLNNLASDIDLLVRYNFVTAGPKTSDICADLPTDTYGGSNDEVQK